MIKWNLVLCPKIVCDADGVRWESKKKMQRDAVITKEHLNIYDECCLPCPLETRGCGGIIRLGVEGVDEKFVDCGEVECSDWEFSWNDHLRGNIVELVSTETGLCDSATICVRVISGYGWLTCRSMRVLRCRVGLLGRPRWVWDSVELEEISPFSIINSTAESCCERWEDLKRRRTPGRWAAILMNRTTTAIEKRTAAMIPMATRGIAATANVSMNAIIKPVHTNRTIAR